MGGMEHIKNGTCLIGMEKGDNCGLTVIHVVYLILYVFYHHSIKK